MFYYFFLGILVAYPSRRWLSSREAEVRIPNCPFFPTPFPGQETALAMLLLYIASAMTLL
jgi:hypothetical protein